MARAHFQAHQRTGRPQNLAVIAVALFTQQRVQPPKARGISPQRGGERGKKKRAQLISPDADATQALEPPSAADAGGGGDRPMGSNEADKPLRRIGASFEQLAAVAKQQQQPAMAAGDFSRACSNVSVLFGCLGIAFKFAEMDYVAKASPAPALPPSPPPRPALL
ncbi:Glycolipid transfer protein [Hordeum vulgare]|nr:Glycolipid transfer protein [Hordeum vulgare]